MLDGYVLVITGASSGIGLATARLAVARGARVVLGARRKERLDELVAELGADHAVAVQMDVRKPEYAEALVQAAVSAFARVDGLLANAGIG